MLFKKIILSLLDDKFLYYGKSKQNICRFLLILRLISILRSDVVVLCLVDTPKLTTLFLSHLQGTSSRLY